MNRWTWGRNGGRAPEATPEATWTPAGQVGGVTVRRFAEGASILPEDRMQGGYGVRCPFSDGKRILPTPPNP